MSGSVGETTSMTGSGSRIGRRGMSPTVAVVILVVVVVVAGVGGFFGLQAVKPSSTSSTTCTPPTACAVVANDISLFVPQQASYGQQYGQLTAGAAFSGTVIPSGAETVKTYSIAWGDGTSTSAPGPTISHSYAAPGLYVMEGSATDTAGGVHSGTAGLFPINVNLSFADSALGTYPSISTSFSNGTVGGYEPWVAVGTTVTVSASYISAAPTPGWTVGAMNITVGTGVTQKTYTPGATSVTGTYALSTVGTDNITMHGSSVGPSGTPVLPISYTWAVYVAPSATGIGCKYCAPPTTAKSPHPGSIVAYEVAPGGAVTLDPAADYYTVGDEVSLNIFQDLVAYNETDVGPTFPNYYPQIATCVPGSGQCTALYGNDLVRGDFYTFVIAKTAKFYDPTTKVSWNVYPSDVFFSIARQLAFSDLPAVAVYPGWIMAQSLLPTGNPAWDGGIHYPYNNTPQNILGSMLVNDSAFCPSAAYISGNGCITFNVNGEGQSWPAFLSYVAHGTAGNIVPAGWYIEQGAGVPGFTTTGGDFPVLLPGAVNSTSDLAFQAFNASQTATSWDSYEALAVTDYPTLESSVAFAEVGSGPYYLNGSANPAIGYVLSANPSFLAPQGCAGKAWCEPAYGTYAKSVTVYWGDSDTAGLEAAQAGQADLIDFEAADIATVLALVQKGDIKLAETPSTSTFNFGYNTNIDLTALKTYDPYPINIQSNSLSYIGLRAFLDAAYPYASVQAQFNQIEGVPFGFNYGGFIPVGMGAYYPTNISWPDYNVTSGTYSNPSTNAAQVGSAAWWWSQLTTSGTPFYDPQFGASGYSSSHPLHVPTLYFLGDPTHQSVLNLWSTYVSSLSGGAIVFDVFPVAPSIVYANLLPDGQCPWALWFLGWAADYEQPYDYFAAYGAGSGTWSAPDTLFPTFSQSQYNASSCGHYDPTFADLVYWANLPYIVNDCQGPAYSVMLYWATTANTAPIAAGILEWNLVSHIYNLLNLYANTQQVYTFQTVGPWINAGTINASPLNGYPGGEEVWFSFTGNGVF